MGSAATIAKGSAALLGLTATLLIAACGSPMPRDFPALTLTNSPDRVSEPRRPLSPHPDLALTWGWLGVEPIVIVLVYST
jgi:hypothetical protein